MHIIIIIIIIIIIFPDHTPSCELGDNKLLEIYPAKLTCQLCTSNHCGEILTGTSVFSHFNVTEKYQS